MILSKFAACRTTGYHWNCNCTRVFTGRMRGDCDALATSLSRATFRPRYESGLRWKGARSCEVDPQISTRRGGVSLCLRRVDGPPGGIFWRIARSTYPPLCGALRVGRARLRLSAAKRRVVKRGQFQWLSACGRQSVNLNIHIPTGLEKLFHQIVHRDEASRLPGSASMICG